MDQNREVTQLLRHFVRRCSPTKNRRQSSAMNLAAVRHLHLKAWRSQFASARLASSSDVSGSEIVVFRFDPYRLGLPHSGRWSCVTLLLQLGRFGHDPLRGRWRPEDDLAHKSHDK